MNPTTQLSLRLHGHERELLQQVYQQLEQAQPVNTIEAYTVLRRHTDEGVFGRRNAPVYIGTTQSFVAIPNVLAFDPLLAELARQNQTITLTLAKAILHILQLPNWQIYIRLSNGELDVIQPE